MILNPCSCELTLVHPPIFLLIITTNLGLSYFLWNTQIIVSHCNVARTMLVQLLAEVSVEKLGLSQTHLIIFFTETWPSQNSGNEGNYFDAAWFKANVWRNFQVIAALLKLTFIVYISANREAFYQWSVSNIRLKDREYNIADPHTRIIYRALLEKAMATSYLNHVILQFVLDTHLEHSVYRFIKVWRIKCFKFYEMYIGIKIFLLYDNM